MRTSLRRLLILVPLAVASPYACSDHDHEPAAVSGYDDVVYEGAVTDEALVSLVAALDQKPLASIVAHEIGQARIAPAR